MMLLRGFGGDDVCKLYSKKCECRPNMQNPFEIWTSPPFTVPVEFQFGGAQYTANFEFKAQVDIVNGRCEDNEGPF